MAVCMTVYTGVGGNGWMYDSLYRCWGKHTVYTGEGGNGCMYDSMYRCGGKWLYVGQYVQVRGEMAVCRTVCTGVGGNGCMYDSMYR